VKPWRVTGDGVLVAVRLTPRAARDGVDGIAADADGRPLLKIRLTAPPVDGKANAALIAFLAETLSVKKADIVIRSGETGRTKLLLLAGDGAGLIARLDGLARKGPHR
jgi:uncharacterized protein (TIGR00251 family)